MRRPLLKVVAILVVCGTLLALMASLATGTVFGRYEEGWRTNGSWRSTNANQMTFNMMEVPNVLDFVRVKIWQVYPSNGSSTRILQDYKYVAISGSMLTTYAWCEKYWPTATKQHYLFCEWRRP